MKIAVDYQSTQGQRTGIGSFAQSLMRDLRPLAPEIEWLLYSRHGEKDFSTPGRVAWETSVAFRAYKDKADLLYSPGFACSAVSPVRQVVTVHDLIGMVFPVAGTLSRLYWSRWLPYTLKRAHRLVASSESTRGDIVRLLGIRADRVRVVPLAAAEHFRKIDNSAAVDATLRSRGIRKPYIISVGTLEPRKNLLRLLHAFLEARKRGLRASLVIVGKGGPAEAELRSFIAAKNLDAMLLGYVSDEELVHLYNGAIGYAFVSLYEGFGYPALEAMRCGRTGVATDRSSVPEITGDTALNVNPENVGEIAEALCVLESDTVRREGLEAAAHRRSEFFSGEKTARAMLEVFREAAA